MAQPNHGTVRPNICCGQSPKGLIEADPLDAKQFGPWIMNELGDDILLMAFSPSNSPWPLRVSFQGYKNSLSTPVESYLKGHSRENQCGL